jgi:hypothetical protein
MSADVPTAAVLLIFLKHVLPLLPFLLGVLSEVPRTSDGI